MRSLRPYLWISMFGLLLALLSARRGPAVSATPPRTVRSLYGLKPPVDLESKKTAVMLIDFQGEFTNGGLPLPDARTAIERGIELARWARRSGMLLVLVQNVVNRPGSPIFVPGSRGAAFVSGLEPEAGDWVIQKSMADAFAHTPLDAKLRAQGVDTLVIGGLMTHLAVFTTVSDASALGYRVLVAADATTTRALPGVLGEPSVDAATVKRATLAAMADRAADVMRVSSIETLPLKR